jgi:folate-binding protein YgfZ
MLPEMTTPMSNEEANWLEHGAGVRVLEDRVLVSVRGEDAHTWLNGQITNDIRSIATGQSIYALIVQLKGRVLADLHVIDRGARGLAVLLPRKNASALLEQFEKYIIMEDVELSMDDATAIITVQGPRANEVVAGVELEVFPSDRLGQGGFDVLVSKSSESEALAMLIARAGAHGGGAVTEAGWELARLRAGRPTLFVDFGETTYPQEAGLKQTAVSFQKGCYLGQEIVCMLESRGQLTRRLVQLESESELGAGAKIQDDTGKEIGEITSALRDPASGRSLALGYVKRVQAVTGRELRTDGSPIKVTNVVEL